MIDWDYERSRCWCPSDDARANGLRDIAEVENRRSPGRGQGFTDEANRLHLACNPPESVYCMRPDCAVCKDAVAAAATSTEGLRSQRDRPGLWSYEGEKHGRHDVSVCVGGFDDGPHECYLTVHAKTEADAYERAQCVVRALRLAESVSNHESRSPDGDGRDAFAGGVGDGRIACSPQPLRTAGSEPADSQPPSFDAVPICPCAPEDSSSDSSSAGVAARPAPQEDALDLMLRDLRECGANRGEPCGVHDRPQWTCAFCLHDVLAAAARPALARPQENADDICEGDVPEVQETLGNRHRTLRGDGLLLPHVSEDREITPDQASKGRLQTPDILALALARPASFLERRLREIAECDFFAFEDDKQVVLEAADALRALAAALPPPPEAPDRADGVCTCGAKTMYAPGIGPFCTRTGVDAPCIPECAHGHTVRVVGCVSCVIVFDRPAEKRGNDGRP
jgi:hypothetical protein